MSPLRRARAVPFALPLCFALLAPLRAQDDTKPEAVEVAASPVAATILDAPFAPTADDLMAHVRFLASKELGGRRAGSPEGRRAAEYIAEVMQKAGLEPGGDDETFRQKFEVAQQIAVKKSETEYEVKKVTLDCANVLGWIDGSDIDAGYILVGAHYDHLGTRGDDVYCGADDNASGIAGLLGIAQAFAADKDRQPRHSILLIAFDGEEDGLRGAEHYARHPAQPLQNLFTMVNLDMIGRGKLLDQKKMAGAKKLLGVPDGPAMGVLGPGKSPQLDEVVRAVFAAEQLPLFAPKDFGMLAGMIEKQAEGRADHAPFERRQIPFLFFSNSEHDDYHKPTDTIETIDAAALHRATRAIYRTLLAIDALETKPEFVDGKQRK